MKQRIITGVLGGVAFLSILYIGQIFLYLIVFLLALIGMYELLKMKKYAIVSPTALYGFLVIGVLFVQYYLDYHFISNQGLIISLVIALIIPVITKNKTTFEDMSFSFFGALYIGLGFYSLFLVRTEMDFLFTLMVLLAVWATDSGAYFTGYVFKGRGPKLWEAISPKKTVVGAIGGTIASCLLVMAIAPALQQSISFANQLLLGTLIAVIGQLGDLVESAYKRSYGVKDSGNILPGHGGILDRFDSLLFVFPIVYVIILYI